MVDTSRACEAHAPVKAVAHISTSLYLKARLYSGAAHAHAARLRYVGKCGALYTPTSYNRQCVRQRSTRLDSTGTEIEPVSISRGARSTRRPRIPECTAPTYPGLSWLGARASPRLLFRFVNFSTVGALIAEPSAHAPAGAACGCAASG